MKTAVVTGATGQDGAYLSRYLIDNGYKVYGTMRRASTINDWRLRALNLLDEPNFYLVEHDVTDMGSTVRLLTYAKPEEVYNLAAQSFVGVSFDQPSTTAQITGVGTLNVLEAIRVVNPSIRFYQASTSEMFGKVQSVPQSETTDFYPRSPYGVAKLFAHWSTVNYRESYDIFGSSGILFNHESPLRGPEFVTRKITLAAAAIARGVQDHLELGNLSAKRDWGYAKEYVIGMHKILQAPTPDTYVLATGRTSTVREFVQLAFEAVDFALDFEGEGEGEVGVCAKTRRPIVTINPAFYRPAEVELLVGDANKAANELGWRAETTLEQLVTKMVSADVQRLESNS